MGFVLDAALLRDAMEAVSRIISDNTEYLTELDSRNGDGDLGISMDHGYKAAAGYLKNSEERDLGKLMMQCGKAFNEAAPSSLGTITSFGMMGMAKALKGKETAALAETAHAMSKGVEMIMEKAGSKPGEKTVLDAICPAVESLVKNASAEVPAKSAFVQAAEAAAKGSESTRQMRSVHGRAAYYGDQSIGQIDGGSVVGKLIFEALAKVEKNT